MQTMFNCYADDSYMQWVLRTRSIKIMLVTCFPMGNAGTWNPDDVRNIRVGYVRSTQCSAVQATAG